jgi:hypothetical protein
MADSVARSDTIHGDTPKSRSQADTEKDDNVTIGGQEPHELFVEPGTIPLPDAGFHAVGVVFEGLTVLGAGKTQKTVDGLEESLLRARANCYRPFYWLNRPDNWVDAGRCGTLLASLANSPTSNSVPLALSYVRKLCYDRAPRHVNLKRRTEPYVAT